MLKTLTDLLNNLLMPPSAAGASGGSGTSGARGGDAEHRLRLATAVMLVEVMRADASFHAGEREAVREALQQKFALAPDEAARLAELAETTAQQSTDLFSFTSRINDSFSAEQKLHMVELMWGVAYADGRLSEHERHVMWRIADLLHVPQGAYHAARQRAQAAKSA